MLAPFIYANTVAASDNKQAFITVPGLGCGQFAGKFRLRSTDDGVKAAATNSMSVMTGVDGYYDVSTYSYNPPKGFKNWNDVIIKRGVPLQVKDNLMVVSV
ncbi:MAG: hypothetical protein R6W78_13020 [Bacteroidales bacterium]